MTSDVDGPRDEQRAARILGSRRPGRASLRSSIGVPLAAALLALAAGCATTADDGRAGADAEPSGAAGASPIAGLNPGQRLADAHFHASNYAIQGIGLRQFVDDYLNRSDGTLVRSVIMPLPLQQRWDSFEGYQAPRATPAAGASGGRVAGMAGARARSPELLGPNYYIGPRADLYYYAFTDAMYAKEYLALPDSYRDRLDLMITGFNPMDRYAGQHIRRAVLTFPGAFVGIGEFTIHKEVVSDKIAGEPIARTAGPGTLPPDVDGDGTMSLYADSVAEVLSTAAEIGLVVNLHNDIYPAEVDHAGKVIALHPERSYADALIALCQRVPSARVVWAHTGLGRYVKPAANHLQTVDRILAACPGWSVDVSWDLVQQTIMKPEAGMPSTEAWRDFLVRNQDRVLWGSDTVLHGRNRFSDAEAVANGTVEAGMLMTPAKFFADAAVLQTFLNTLPPEAAEKIRYRNYERLFDGARGRVRAWEQGQAGADVWDLPAPQPPGAPIQRRSAQP